MKIHVTFLWCFPPFLALHLKEQCWSSFKCLIQHELTINIIKMDWRWKHMAVIICKYSNYECISQREKSACWIWTTRGGYESGRNKNIRTPSKGSEIDAWAGLCTILFFKYPTILLEEFKAEQIQEMSTASMIQFAFVPKILYKAAREELVDHSRLPIVCQYALSREFTVKNENQLAMNECGWSASKLSAFIDLLRAGVCGYLVTMSVFCHLKTWPCKKCN